MPPSLVGEVSRLGYFRNSGTGRSGAVLIVVRERGDDNHRTQQEGTQGKLAGAALWSQEDNRQSREVWELRADSHQRQEALQ